MVLYKADFSNRIFLHLLSLLIFLWQLLSFLASLLILVNDAFDMKSVYALQAVHLLGRVLLLIKVIFHAKAHRLLFLQILLPLQL